MTPEADAVAVTLKSGDSLTAALVVGADGRHSMCRARPALTRRTRLSADGADGLPDAFAPAPRRLDRISHRQRSVHAGASARTTLQPGLGARSGRADEIAALDDAALAEEIERASHSLLGKITVEPGRGLFPLGVATARTFAANRIALVGEAAHVIPPIGAQGLNLGLRDAASIGERAVAALRDGDDIGGGAVLADYDRMRRADVGSRAIAIDLMNRTLLTDSCPCRACAASGST